jgi:AraC-like DNA-binding protein
MRMLIGYSMGIRSERRLTRWRMVLAQHKLNAGETVAAVATAVGYNSRSAFSHAFKRSFGRTPRWEPTECG